MAKVRYEEMLPHELDEAVARFPVAYCPFGSLEWHGRHLPLGNDTLKAHHLLLLTARKYGGVVVPPTYWGILGKWHDWTMADFGQDLVDRLYTGIFEGLVDVGFKVVIGLTGHDVQPQKAAIEKAVAAIQAKGGATGSALMEGDLYDLTDDRMDHAAHWETSLLMYLRPELVDLSRITAEDLDTEAGVKAAGIFGRDPRRFASRELGERIATGIADAIGHRAQQLLASLGSASLGSASLG